jgi:phospholipid/cholesterol/gamma-HCH transport system substrate-binding protein
MNRLTIDLWVGIFVAIGIAALLFLSLKVGNLSGANLQQPYQLTAKFDNIGGLKIRGPVKSAGVVVGRVNDIAFDPQTYEAVVTMNVDGRYQFPKDTYASILTAGLLGEQYIGLDAGSSDTMLGAGGKLSRTQSAVVLEKLIGQFLFNKAAEGQEPAK